jgi:hypothetical protein
MSKKLYTYTSSDHVSECEQCQVRVAGTIHNAFEDGQFYFFVRDVPHGWLLDDSGNVFCGLECFRRYTETDLFPSP